MCVMKPGKEEGIIVCVCLTTGVDEAVRGIWPVVARARVEKR